MPELQLLAELPSPPPGKTGWPWTEQSAPMPACMEDGKPWPKISIVTPNFNQAEFIEETIRSVLLQNYPNLEYIIIDGGSTDGSVDIIEKYAPWLAYWHSEKDKGIYDAFNIGVQLSTGQFINIIASDDWYEPNILKRIALESLMLKIPRIIFGSMREVSFEGRPGRIYLNLSAQFPLSVNSNHPTWFVPKRVYEKVGLYSLSYQIASDYELLVRLCQQNIQFIYLDTILVNHRQGGVSTNPDYWYKTIREFLTIQLAFGLISHSRYTTSSVTYLLRFLKKKSNKLYAQLFLWIKIKILGLNA